jgi:IMP cyclohydrolase
MQQVSLETELGGNPYPGRGIVLGQTENEEYGVCVYFIMGRSENSRNRIFVQQEDGIRTQAFDEAKLTDPSLIIYTPVRVLQNRTIVTNGDQTDTIYELMSQHKTFEQSLRTRSFEPDAPNYTPRISGIMKVEKERCSYALSILKSDNGRPDACNRFLFAYENPTPGEGHFIHTYQGDGNPLPSFEGEPKRVAISNDIELFTQTIWNSLSEENKVSLFVRYIHIKNQTTITKIINKNQSN